MADSKHTPKPWKWVRDRTFYMALEGDNGADILYAEEYAGSAWIEIGNAADASLIDAAPDLLSVLKEAIDNNRIVDDPDWWGRVLAAIAKAERK